MGSGVWHGIRGVESGVGHGIRGVGWEGQEGWGGEGAAELSSQPTGHQPRADLL